MPPPSPHRHQFATRQGKMLVRSQAHQGSPETEHLCFLGLHGQVSHSSQRGRTPPALPQHRAGRWARRAPSAAPYGGGTLLLQPKQGDQHPPAARDHAAPRPDPAAHHEPPPARLTPETIAPSAGSLSPPLHEPPWKSHFDLSIDF